MVTKLSLPSTTEVSMGICSGEDWEFIHGDASLGEFLNQPAEQLLGKSFIELLRDMGLERTAKAIKISLPDQNIYFDALGKSYIFRWSTMSTAIDPSNAKTRNEHPRVLLLYRPQTDESPTGINLDTSMKTILNSVHDGIWIIDAQGVTIYVNRAMRRIANINTEEVIGQHVTVPLHKGVFSSCVTLEALGKKEIITRFDDYASGKRCLNTSTPFFDKDGTISCVVACIRDMSELEALQTKLAKTEQTARRYKEQLEGQKSTQTTTVIAQSPTMRSCLSLLERSATVSSNVLLLGETGTGKTLAARYIHSKSSRANKPFVTVNCAAIPPTLIESELFGYEKGAFTGANTDGKKGFFQMADTGTLFLDEIGELPIAMQAKLLHVLDNFTFHRVGGTKQITVDVRVVTATNRPLEELVEAGKFREDLFYRLRVLTATVPPLRERTEDIPPMAYHFLEEACKRYGINKYFEPKIIDHLVAYPWPGNVRELHATVEFLAVMAEGNIIKPRDLPPQIKPCATEDEDIVEDLKTAVQQLESTMIRNALLKAGSTYKAAKILGVSQSTVVRKAQSLDIKIS